MCGVMAGLAEQSAMTLREFVEYTGIFAVVFIMAGTALRFIHPGNTAGSDRISDIGNVPVAVLASFSCNFHSAPQTLGIGPRMAFVTIVCQYPMKLVHHL